jgi:hypothetical protein
MYSSLIRIHHQNEQTKKRDLKNIQDIMVFLGTLNEKGNFTYSQAEEKCVLCSPISSLGCASARTSDETDALFDLRTQITIIFIVFIQVSFKEFTVFYIVKYLTKKLKKKRFQMFASFSWRPKKRCNIVQSPFVRSYKEIALQVIHLKNSICEPPHYC